MRKLFIILLITSSACGSINPFTKKVDTSKLSTTGQAYLKQDGLVNALKFVGDSAIDANHRGLVSIHTTRLILLYLEDASSQVKAGAEGYIGIIKKSFVQLLKQVPDLESQILSSAFSAVTTLLDKL